MSASDLRRDRSIAERMERAWSAFFASFGRLTSVQRAVIPDLLRGHDLLICSATASGKTEAACAPLVERHLSRTTPWTILYISPTRALVNDLYGRLEAPLDRLGLRLARRTGDHKQGLGAAPHVLLTTPESFDSLLCRGKLAEPKGHHLARVVAVVLDEIHLLHGNARGEQVRWLLQRLRRLRTEARRKGWAPDARIQVVGLSATVADPRSVAAAFLTDGKVIAIPGGREIQTVVAPAKSPAVEEALPAYIAERGAAEKIIIFSNARRRVDSLTVELRRKLAPLGYQVLAHHGSLARKVREAAEAAARTEQRIVLVATSTLEIGVDIGGLDLVVLDGPAPGMPALLQRIGRGNRRTQITRVMTCAASLAEVLVQSAMIDAARSGWLGAPEAGPHHAVARQQIASYIYQAPKRTRSREQLQALLAACSAPLVQGHLIDQMLQSEELIQDDSGVRLGREWMDRAARGEVHANIEGSLGATVSDAITGEKLASGVAYRGGERLHVGGQLLQVKQWDQRKIEVRRLKGTAPVDGAWSYSSRAWMQGAGQPQAVARYLGLEEGVWPVITKGVQTYVFHLGGARRRAVLELMAAGRGPGGAPVVVTPWYLCLPEGGAKPDWVSSSGRGMLELELAARVGALERLLGRPQANQHLPVNLRIDEVRGWLNLEEEVGAVQASRWEEPDPDTALGLACLVL